MYLNKASSVRFVARGQHALSSSTFREALVAAAKGAIPNALHYPPHILHLQPHGTLCSLRCLGSSLFTIMVSLKKGTVLLLLYTEQVHAPQD